MSKSKLCTLCLGILLVLPCLALAAGTKPVISSISPTSATAGSAALVLTVSGTGFARGSIVLWNGSALPTTWVSSAEMTAEVPATALASTGSATVSVYIPGRTGGTSNSVAFTISSGTQTTGSTGTALAITTTSIPAGATGTAYTATLAATGGTSPYTWSVSSGALPAGLTLSSAGAISGTPTTSGSASFTAQVKDSASSPNVQTYTYSTTIAVGISISPSSLPGGTTGTAYTSTTLGATGGTSPYTWSVASGNTLPAGLSLSSAGVLSGTPTTANTYRFSIQVTDSASNTATQAYSLTVAAASAASFTPTSGGVLLSCDFDTTCTSLPGLFTIYYNSTGTAAISTAYAHSGTHSLQFQISGAAGVSEMSYTFGASGHPAGELLNPALSSTGIYRRWWQLVLSDYAVSLACDGGNRQYKTILDRGSPPGNTWIMGGSRADWTPCPVWSQMQDAGMDGNPGSSFITGQLVPGQWYELQTWYQRVTDGSETNKVIGTGNGTQTSFVYDLGHYPDLTDTVVSATIGGVVHTGVIVVSYPQTAESGCTANSEAICELVTSGGVFGVGNSGTCLQGTASWDGVACPSKTSVVLNFTTAPDNGTSITITDTWGHGNVRVWVNGTLQYDNTTATSGNHYWGTDNPNAAMVLAIGFVYSQNVLGPTATTYIDDYVQATQYVVP